MSFNPTALSADSKPFNTDLSALFGRVALLFVLIAMVLYPIARYYSEAGLVPYAREGFYAIASVTCVLLTLGFVLQGLTRTSLSGYLFLTYCLSLLMIIVGAYFSAKIVEPVLRFEFFFRDTVMVMTSLTWFLAGLFLNLHNKRRDYFSIGFYIFLGFVLFNIDPNKLLIDLSQFDNEGAASYQYWGDVFVMLTMLALAEKPERSLFKRLIFVGLAVLALFVLRSRTSLYGFVIMTPLFFMRDFFQRPMRWIFVALVLSLVTWIVWRVLPTLDLGAGNRMLALLNPEADSSGMQREILLSIGNQVISHNPIFGDYANNADRFGLLAYYTHNIWDIWSQFGLLPFLFFCLSVVLGLFVALPALWRTDRSPAVVWLLLFSVFCWVLSRNQSFTHLMFPMGLAAAMAWTIKRNNA